MRQNSTQHWSGTVSLCFPFCLTSCVFKIAATDSPNLWQKEVVAACIIHLAESMRRGRCQQRAYPDSNSDKRTAYMGKQSFNSLN